LFMRASTLTYKEALAFLESRIDYERALLIPYTEREFQLDRMRTLLSRLDDPHQRLKIIHVAGTKGKGSTSAMIASVLPAAGYRTGLYTSPHLDRLEERFVVDGQSCSEDELARLVEQVHPVVDEMDRQARFRSPTEPGPTYFEVTTAMALLHFAAAKVDAAILEVGLGGRLDSTNVCQPMVSVITSISFDHTKQLGSTLVGIAAEKAGIIKPGVPVVSGVVEAEPRQVIAEVARRQNSRLIQASKDFSFDYHPALDFDSSELRSPGTLDFKLHSSGRERRLSAVEVNLPGRHQAANAAVAVAALDELTAQGWRIPENAIRRGLADVHCPARIEIVSRQPAVIIDSAHNTASIQSLRDTLKESFSSPRRLLIFAATQEKDIRGMLELLLPNFEAVILTRYSSNPRGVSIADLDEIAAEISPIPRHLCPDPSAAWNQARRLTNKEHLICITGSFFLAAEMRQAIAVHRADRTKGQQLAASGQPLT
jgi:dihydrofolate synthase / folylpolyglutamate synthase